jgi:hypothetical protein
MDFRTKIPFTNPGFLLSFADRMMVIGSCFAENIGTRLDDSGFRVMTNPFGVLYNPSSISMALRRLIKSEPFHASELTELDGLYHSFSHHGSFSDSDAVITLDHINESFSKAAYNFRETDCLMLTFGTAWVYALTESGQIVANCHKFPANSFNRLRLTVDDITLDYDELFEDLLKIKPDLRIILTVSPIRHLNDGVHENTLSKSVLHLAVENLCNRFENVVYYPSYELMMDDLRDYRFYDVDMLHPSSVAQDYIWEHFSETFLTKPSREMAKQVQQIRKAMNHKPLHDNDDAYVRFAQKNIASIEMLKIRVPEIDLKEEMTFFENILNHG